MGIALAVSGSFDMMTNGHLWLIKQAAKMTDNLTVYIPVNPNKSSMIPLATRITQMKQVLSDNQIDAHVETVLGEYTAVVAARQGIEFLVRGGRRASEFDYEASVHEANMDIAAVPTMLLIPPPDTGKISSSYVKALMSQYPIGWHRQVKALVPQVVYEYIRLQYLQAEWNKLWDDDDERCSTDMSISPSVLKSMFNELIAAYSQPHRHYHNLDHIVHMLTEIDVWGKATNADEENIRLLKTAAWYHDAVYLPTRKDTPTDEQLSAKMWFQQPYRSYHGFDQALIVSDLIHVTNHFAGESINVRLKDEMLDADLAILGQPPKVYKEYAQAIRHEYAHVSDFDFYTGRQKVLAHFCEQGNNLYRTNHYHVRYHAQAMTNLWEEYEAIGMWLHKYNQS